MTPEHRTALMDEIEALKAPFRPEYYTGEHAAHNAAIDKALEIIRKHASHAEEDFRELEQDVQTVLELYEARTRLMPGFITGKNGERYWRTDVDPAPIIKRLWQAAGNAHLHRQQREADVERVAVAIRDSDGLGGDPLAVLLDEVSVIDASTSTRQEADELIMRVCRNAAIAALAAMPAEKEAGEQELREKLEGLAIAILPHYQSLKWKEGTASAILDIVRPYLRAPSAPQVGDLNEAIRFLEHLHGDLTTGNDTIDDYEAKMNATIALLAGLTPNHREG